MKPEPQEKTQDAQPGLLHPVVVPRYATNTESLILAVVHTATFWLVVSYDWRLGIAYLLHTVCCVWKSPMIWKRHNDKAER